MTDQYQGNNPIHLTTAPAWPRDFDIRAERAEQQELVQRDIKATVLLITKVEPTQQ